MSERWLWTQKQDIGPSPRTGFAMAYDPSRKRVVVFGGTTGTKLLNDTWEWDGETWTQIADMGPGPRDGADMVYDQNRERLVLFGGYSSVSPLTGETWELQAAEWTQVADTGPAARYGHSMAYDRKHRQVVLFGGRVTSLYPRDFIGDTWGWDGAEWTQIEDIGPPRGNHGMVYDKTRECLVLFGGITRSENGIDAVQLGDTWERGTSGWVKREDAGPSARWDFALTFAAERTILFGGIINPTTGTPSGDTWEWDGTFWRQRQNMGPLPRSSHRMVYDEARDRIVFFGGGLADRKTLGDTWELKIASSEE